MSRRWFMPLGWIYVPISVPGALATLLTLAFLANTFLAIDRNSHSASDIFPFWVPALMLLHWVASNTSAPRSPK